MMKRKRNSPYSTDQAESQERRSTEATVISGYDVAVVGAGVAGLAACSI